MRLKGAWSRITEPKLRARAIRRAAVTNRREPARAAVAGPAADRPVGSGYTLLLRLGRPFGGIVGVGAGGKFYFWLPPCRELKRENGQKKNRGTKERNKQPTSTPTIIGTLRRTHGSCDVHGADRGGKERKKDRKE